MKLQKILNNRKGFTLMEIIVVLIIIAVLAAALIPSFVGFIRDARAATAINQARMGMTAAQVILTEQIGNEPTVPFTFGANGVDSGTTGGWQGRFWNMVADDVPADARFTAITIITDGTNPGTRVSGLTYTGGGWQVIINQTDGAVATRLP